MGVDLEWQDEEGQALSRVEDLRNEFSRALSSGDLEDTSCLRFVDLYGDTLFNQLQIADLVLEMRELAESTGASSILSEMIDLVEKARGGTHTYLRFVGD